MAKTRILIGEDEPNVLKVTKTRLEHEGYEVLTAEDGEAVLERALRERVHLILLDIKMPRLNGLDVCRVLKSRAATAGIPVIVYSGSERQLEQLADRCIEIGAADWLSKPFKTADLLGKIQRALGTERGEA
jgi:two-component system alkaline phosphatase synthesis response regulator PhoP